MTKAEKRVRATNVRVGRLLASLGEPLLDATALVTVLTTEPLGTHAQKEDDALQLLIRGYSSLPTAAWVNIHKQYLGLLLKFASQNGLLKHIISNDQFSSFKELCVLSAAQDQVKALEDRVCARFTVRPSSQIKATELIFLTNCTGYIYCFKFASWLRLHLFCPPADRHR
jgi:hypothetical protein